MLLFDVCLSRTSGLSREQRPRKTKIGTRDSDTTFKVKRSKVNLLEVISSIFVQYIISVDTDFNILIRTLPLLMPFVAPTSRNTGLQLIYIRWDS